jgi:hypothetical protein
MRSTIFSLLSSLLGLLLGCQRSPDPTTGPTRVSGQVVQGQGRLPLPYAYISAV